MTSRCATSAERDEQRAELLAAVLLQAQRALEPRGIELAALDQDLAEALSCRCIHALLCSVGNVQKERSMIAQRHACKSSHEPHESRCCERFFRQTVVIPRRRYDKMSLSPDDLAVRASARSKTQLAPRHERPCPIPSSSRSTCRSSIRFPKTTRGGARASPNGATSCARDRISTATISRICPADLGFYDLRVPETRIEQAELARQLRHPRLLLLLLLVQRPAAARATARRSASRAASAGLSVLRRAGRTRTGRGAGTAGNDDVLDRAGRIRRRTTGA